MLHLIHTHAAMLVSKRAWSSWQEIQDAHQGYMASLGPWSQCEMIDYLQDEYAQLCPSAEVQVAALMAGTCDTVELAFRPAGI